MEAQLLDVAENEECILHLALFNDALQVLVLDQVLVHQLLRRRKRQPNHQVRLQGQLVKLEGSTGGLGADDFENLVLGSPQEVGLVHGAHLSRKPFRLGFVGGKSVLEQSALNHVGVLVLEGLEGAEDLRLHEVEDGP